MGLLIELEKKPETRAQKPDKILFTVICPLVTPECNEGRMAKITIDREKCKGCLLCISFCPKGLISVDKGLNRRGAKPVKFHEKAKCLGCAMCAIICPDCCIEVYK